MPPTKHIPGAEEKRFWQKKWMQELFFNVPPLIAACVTTYRFFPFFESSDTEIPPISLWVFYLSVVAIFWLVLTSIWKIKIASDSDKKETPETVHEGLYAAVSTMQVVLNEYCKRRNCGKDIRATFHRVVPPLDNPTEIEQIINYAGAHGNKDRGRRFSINTGITGQAIRSKKPIMMSSSAQTEEQHRSELVANWGYTEQQARALTSGKFSAAAVPVLNATGHSVLGVIYLDSSERSIFDRSDIQEILATGSLAVSEFVTKRY